MPQYSQNVSEQIMKSDKLGSGLPWGLLIFSIFLFALSLLAYLGLHIGYAGYLNSQISAKDQAIDQLTKKVSPEVQGVFVGFYSRLTNYKNLLSSHVYTDKIFPLLEKITNPSVYYNNFSLDIINQKLVLSGLAANYEALGQQLYQFDRDPADPTNKNPMISGYILNQSRVVEGLVNFQVTLILSPKLFEK